MASLPLIQTRSLSKIFTRGGEEIYALNSVNVTIAQGEFVAITGPSGSGKSTLLYILGLIDSPTSGEYFLDGNATSALSDTQRAGLRNQKLGFVFQSFHLLARANALRNVTMPLIYSRAHGKALTHREMEQKALAALARVGLQDRIHHLPNELSGGQRQRVAIARALINDPQVVLADEPTGNLDSRTGKEVLDLFEHLNEGGVTIVLVTHDPASSARARRIIRLEDGHVAHDEIGRSKHATQ